jgi:hypothetical protein
MSKTVSLCAALAASLTLIAAAPAIAQVDRQREADRSRDRDRVERPDVPSTLEVDARYKPYLRLQADGTQNYICLATATGVAWTFLGPQATLFDDDLDQVTTHYLSPNPQEAGLARATWRHSKDTSTVWAMAVASSSEAPWVTPGAIPWLKLQIVGAQLGPDGGRRLAVATFIQRVNTAGGAAPVTGCAATTDIGRRVFVPYSTDYVFYR